jgi:hypothetical protein
MLHIAAAAAFRNYSRVIAPLDGDSAVAVESVVYIHSAPGIVHIATAAIGSGANGGAVRGVNFATACRSRMSGKV